MALSLIGTCLGKHEDIHHPHTAACPPAGVSRPQTDYTRMPKSPDRPTPAEQTDFQVKNECEAYHAELECVTAANPCAGLCGDAARGCAMQLGQYKEDTCRNMDRNCLWRTENPTRDRGDYDRARAECSQINPLLYPWGIRPQPTGLFPLTPQNKGCSTCR